MAQYVADDKHVHWDITGTRTRCRHSLPCHRYTARSLHHCIVWCNLQVKCVIHAWAPHRFHDVVLYKPTFYLLTYLLTYLLYLYHCPPIILFYVVTKAVMFFFVTRNAFCRSRSLSNATILFLITWSSSSSKSAAVYKMSSKSDDFSLRYCDITIFKMAAVRHLGIVLPPYETTHEVSVAGRSCLSNFMSIWYTDLKI